MHFYTKIRKKRDLPAIEHAPSKGRVAQVRIIVIGQQLIAQLHISQWLCAIFTRLVGSTFATSNCLSVVGSIVFENQYFCRSSVF